MFDCDKLTYRGEPCEGIFPAFSTTCPDATLHAGGVIESILVEQPKSLVGMVGRIPTETPFQPKKVTMPKYFGASRAPDDTHALTGGPGQGLDFEAGYVLMSDVPLDRDMLATVQAKKSSAEPKRQVGLPTVGQGGATEVEKTTFPIVALADGAKAPESVFRTRKVRLTTDTFAETVKPSSGPMPPAKTGGEIEDKPAWFVTCWSGDRDRYTDGQFSSPEAVAEFINKHEDTWTWVVRMYSRAGSFVKTSESGTWQ